MAHNSRYVLAVVFAAAVASFSLSCGGGSPASTPSTITTTTTTTRPSVTPTPAANSCPLGMGTDAFDCSRTSTQLLPYVEDAMDMLISQRPQIFDLNDEVAPGTHAYRILDRDAYMNGVVANLQTQGLCAQRDVDDVAQQTIAAKNSNAFSEEFDVILSTGYMRRGNGAYRTTCTPAAFPLDRPADAPPLGSGCYTPFPPPIAYMNCKLNIPGGEYATLDSTPIVSDPVYCLSVGFPPERPECPIRPEGASDRRACENWRTGNALDTGRPGPTWTYQDGEDWKYCTGPDSGCANSPDNQYALWAYRNGTYRVCAQTGRCCNVVVDKF